MQFILIARMHVAGRSAAVGAKEKARSAGSGSGRTELARAAFAAIRPILRVLLELGITSPEAESLLRSLLVHEATAWLSSRSGGAEPSDSRVAFATGLHRNVIREILAEPPQIPSKRAGRGYRAGRLIEAWHTDPDYQNAHGNPLDLPERGAAPSLAALVSRHLRGASCGAVLAEFMRSGAVESLPDRRLRVRTRHALPGGLTLEGLRAYGEHGHALLATLTTRLLDPAPGSFCDSTAVVEVDGTRVGVLRDVVRRRSRAFLDGLERELARDAARGRRRGETVQVAVTVIETDRKSRSRR